jgi:hypothetical protein
MIMIQPHYERGRQKMWLAEKLKQTQPNQSLGEIIPIWAALPLPVQNLLKQDLLLTLAN